LTLYITAATRQAEAIQVLHKADGQGTYYWVHKGMGYALSGRTSKSNLQSMAIEICTALGGNPKLWQ
jgi:anti-sigma factor RsiW